MTIARDVRSDTVPTATSSTRTTSTGTASAAPVPETYYRGVMPTLWRLFGPYRRDLVLGLVLRMAASLATGVPVAVVAWVVQHIRQDTLTTGRAVTASTIVLAVLAVQYCLSFASNRYAWTSTFLAVGESRIRALRHVQSLPVPTIASRRVGDISAVLTSDFEQVSAFAHHGLITLVGGAALPVAALLGLFCVDPLLAVTVAASIVLAVPVFTVANRIFRVRALQRADLLAEANSRMIEYVQGIATARSYNQIGQRQLWFRDSIARMRRVNDELAVKLTPLAYLTMAVVLLGIPTLIAVSGYGLFGGPFDAGTVVVFLVVVLRVYEPLIAVALQVEPLRLADAALRRIGRIQDLEPQRAPTTPVAVPTGHDVRFEKVGFGYEADRPVLTDLDFTARAGTTTAIVGPSGAGKSTVLALASRFYDPDRGTVSLGGVPLTDLTTDQLFDAVTVVFQDVYLFAGTIRDNIAFGDLNAPDEAVEDVAKAARCHEFVSALPEGYLTRIGEGGMTLSGGERQRISIARAMLKNAPVVLLDEATSALDSLNEEAVGEALASLVEGRTVIVVAHRLATIRSADQILVLDSGRIVQRGGHSDLLREGGLYARLWAERERASRWRLSNES
jgi:ATP-binding cassette, subfamily B, bacterial IrtB/YbtQ